MRSTAGREAGVWVIAETKDLPTGMIKSVVTDDQGRYVLPEYADGSELQRLGPRLRPGRFQAGYSQSHSSTRQQCTRIEPHRRRRQERRRSGEGLPGQLLDADARASCKVRVPARNGPVAADRSKAGCTPSNRAATSAISSATRSPARWITSSKQSPNSRLHTEAWDYRLQTGVRGSGMSGAASQLEPALRTEDVRRLDGSHRQGRNAQGEASSSSGN